MVAQGVFQSARCLMDRPQAEDGGGALQGVGLAGCRSDIPGDDGLGDLRWRVTMEFTEFLDELEIFTCPAAQGSQSGRRVDAGGPGQRVDDGTRSARRFACRRRGTRQGNRMNDVVVNT